MYNIYCMLKSISRFFKLFFSRLFIVGIIIIFQVYIFVAINFWLNESFYWVPYFFTTIAIIMFFYVLNKDKPASFKLPWTVLLLLIPLVGIAVYILFGNYNLTRKDRKKMQKESKELIRFCKRNDETMQVLKDSNIQAYGQAQYIENTCLMPTYENCNVKFLSSGENFYLKLLEELKTAEKYIFMEYFIIEKGKMWNSILEVLEEKVKQGVEVCFMYDDVGCISKVKKDYYLELRDKGIQACKFNPFKPVISVMHNNRDHRKITVIDGVKGFVSGANLADEYINETHPYGLWYDNAVFLEGKCIDSLVLMFIRMYNPNSVKKLNAKDYLVEHKKFNTKGFVAPYCDGPCPIYNDYIGQNVYLNLINQAKKYLYITTPYLIVDYEFIEAIINAKKRGVDVILITPNIPDKKIINIMTKSNYGKLIENGVKIYEYKDGFIHSKMIVCDDELASIGTINLDYRSFVHHFECGVWMYNCKDILQMKKTFLAIIKDNSVKITNNNSKLKFYQKLIRNILRLLAPLM